jgi:nucleoside-diphosphate-sugar epimerase
MRILVTGADQPLGTQVARALRDRHELRLTGTGALGPAGLEGLPYTPADLCDPEQARTLVADVEAIAHLAPYAPAPDVTTEARLLQSAAQGTFVLLRAALPARVRRVVLASRLEVMAGHPPEYVVDENWKPQPETTAAGLAPFLAELTLREFVRAEEIVGVCLRFGELGSGPAGTTPEDAVAAVERALTMELEGRKYRWWLCHVCSGERYRSRRADDPPFRFQRRSA